MGVLKAGQEWKISPNYSHFQFCRSDVEEYEIVILILMILIKNFNSNIFPGWSLRSGGLCVSQTQDGVLSDRNPRFKGKTSRWSDLLENMGNFFLSLKSEMMLKKIKTYKTAT